MSETIALAMVGRSTVSFEVMMQWITALRKVHWPGPTFLMPEIYAAGAWTGVVPLRNLCTYVALKDPSWGWLLWIDADHKVNHTMFERLQDHVSADRAITGGVYFGRGYPFEVQAFSERVEGGVKYVPPEVLVPALQQPRQYVRNEPQWPVLEVAGVGTGCMLVRRDVLERMAERRGHVLNVWRADRIEPDEQLKLLQGTAAISSVMTEDILFCIDVAELLGEKTWLDLDPRMETGHMGEEARDRRHYIASHTVPDNVKLDTDAVKRSGYEVVSTERERARRLRRG